MLTLKNTIQLALAGDNVIHVAERFCHAEATQSDLILACIEREEAKLSILMEEISLEIDSDLGTINNENDETRA